jgi:hypothetical protein
VKAKRDRTARDPMRDAGPTDARSVMRPPVLRARLVRPEPSLAAERAPHPVLGFHLDGDALKWGRKFLACGPARVTRSALIF